MSPLLVATSSRDRITALLGGASSKARMAVTSLVCVFVELLRLLVSLDFGGFIGLIDVILMAVFMEQLLHFNVLLASLIGGATNG